jgi:hypothetical protein
VLGIPTLIAFLKKIRACIQDGATGGKGGGKGKGEGGGGGYLLPPHKLGGRQAGDVVYYQVRDLRDLHLSPSPFPSQAPGSAVPGLQPVPFPPGPEARAFASPAPRALAGPSRIPFPAGTSTSTSTPFSSGRASPPVSFPRGGPSPAAAFPSPGPLLDLSVVKPLTASCINTPAPQVLAPRNRATIQPSITTAHYGQMSN